jgi:hypothetical protein
MNALRPAGRSVAGPLLVALLLAACSSGAGASVAPSIGPSATPPDAPVSAPPSTGVGTDPGAPGDPANAFVVPKPGQLDVHPIPIDSFAARVDGSTIVVTATWTSGVEPCNVLDRIVVDPTDGTFTITLREGHGPQEIACIAIAQIKKTEFEIPTTAPGTYTIADAGGLAAPIQVTVS